MIIYIDVNTLALTTEGHVPLTDMVLVRGDKVPLRIVLTDGPGLPADSDEVPVLAVKKSLGDDALVLAATGMERVTDALGTAYVGSLSVNTVQLATVMGDQDRIDLIGEVVLVAPDGAQRTSRLVRVTVRADLLVGDYAPPAEVLADWSALVASALAAQLPGALHDAGMYVTPVSGMATMSPPGYDQDQAVAWSWARFRFGDDMLTGYAGSVCKVRDVYVWAVIGTTDTTPRWLDVWRRAPGGDWVLAARSTQAVASSPDVDLYMWEMIADTEIIIGDEVALHVYGGTPEAPIELPLSIARQMVTAADGRGIAESLDGPITDATVMPAMMLSCTYNDGVRVGGVDLATRAEVDRTKDYVSNASKEVYASARQVSGDADQVAADKQAVEAARAALVQDIAAAQAILDAIPQMDAAGNMTLAGGLTTAGTINANGGINIPAAVAPRLTGAVTNHELVDYLVDRVVRTAPFMTRISGLELADFYDKSQSTSPLTLYPYSGEVRLNGPTGANNVSKAVFAGPGGHSIIVPPTQCGPYYYQKHVTVISSSSLLCMSYLTSPGAMVQMKLGVSDDAQHYGVRLRNDDGAAYYELFYKDVADDQETVAVREPVPKDVNLYRGDHSAQSRLNSLVIYVPGNFNGTSRTAVKFGQWSMTVPFALFNNAQLELSARTGNVAINYYGAGLGVSIGSIHQLALDYQEQFVPTLNNAAYQS